VLAKLKIERSKRLVEKKHLRPIYESAGNCYTLLLTA
jgi:hypothetical protein